MFSLEECHLPHSPHYPQTQLLSSRPFARSIAEYCGDSSLSH